MNNNYNYNYNNNNNGAYQQPYQYQQTYYNPSYMPIKKEYKPFETKDNRFIIIFLAAMFLMVDFGFFTALGLGFTISYFILFIASTAYLYSKENKFDVFSVTCGVLSLLGAVTFALFCNPLMSAIMFVLVFGLFSVYCIGISGCFKSKKGSFKMLFDLAMGTFLEPFENIADIIGSIKAGNKNNKKRYSVLFGILLAIPVLLIVVQLLMKSDAAFEGLMKAIAKNIGKYLVELVITVFITPFLFSYMFGKRNRLNAEKKSSAFERREKFPAAGSVSFLSVISVAYLVYLFSQLAYFFSAFKGILPKGYSTTASEFARRGFYEMFAVCAINIVLISVVTAFTKKKEGKVYNSVKAVSLFISLFSVVLIISAIQKMKLNITTYGFTANRLLVFTFMLMILVVIAFFVLHIFAPKISYMQPIIIICSILFIALSYSNVDNLAFKYNVKAYQSGNIKSIDILYIDELCPSEEYYIKLIKLNDKKYSHMARSKLLENEFNYKRETYENTSNKYTLKDGKITYKKKDFRYLCLENARAEKAVEIYYNDLNKTEKEAFDDTLNKLSKCYYFHESDTFEDTNNGMMYKYNEKTDKYDIKQMISEYNDEQKNS